MIEKIAKRVLEKIALTPQFVGNIVAGAKKANTAMRNTLTDTKNMLAPKVQAVQQMPAGPAKQQAAQPLIGQVNTLKQQGSRLQGSENRVQSVMQRMQSRTNAADLAAAGGPAAPVYAQNFGGAGDVQDVVKSQRAQNSQMIGPGSRVTSRPRAQFNQSYYSTIDKIESNKPTQVIKEDWHPKVGDGYVYAG